jgi:hypothetical protein
MEGLVGMAQILVALQRLSAISIECNSIEGFFLLRSGGFAISYVTGKVAHAH